MQEQTKSKRLLLSTLERFKLMGYLEKRLESKLPLFPDFQTAIQSCQDELGFKVTKSHITHAARLVGTETKHEPYRSFVFVGRSPRGVNKKKEAAEARRQARLQRNLQQKPKTDKKSIDLFEPRQNNNINQDDVLHTLYTIHEHQIDNIFSQLKLLNNVQADLILRIKYLESMVPYVPITPRESNPSQGGLHAPMCRQV